MIKLIINKKTYYCKTTENLNIKKFTKFSKAFSEMVTPEEMTLFILNELSNIPKLFLNHITKESLLQIDISKIFIIKEIKIDIDLNSISFGKFIDIEQYLINENYQLAVSRLLLPNSIDPKEIEEQKEYNNIEAINYINIFQKWKLNLFKSYSDILIKDENEENKEIDKTNHWLNLFQSLIADDPLKMDKISKMRFTEILFYLKARTNENLKTSKRAI